MEDASLLAGPGFKDLTRLASGDPTMSRDIMMTNRDAVLHWIQRLQTELTTITDALQLGHEPIFDLFQSTQFDRDNFLLNPPERRRPQGPSAVRPGRDWPPVRRWALRQAERDDEPPQLFASTSR